MQKSTKKELCQLSCARCFTPVSYSGMKAKNDKRGDYFADVKAVINIIIDQSKIAVSKKLSTQADEEFEMLLFKGRCKECEEEIVLYDFEKKTVFFKDVVPNYIG